MSVTERALQVIQGDDPTLNLGVTTASGAPYDLTGQRLDFLVKAGRNTPDSSLMFLLTSQDGQGITINVDPATGLAVADFTNRFPASGKFWYRTYVAAEGTDPTVERHTWSYGDLIVVAA